MKNIDRLITALYSAKSDNREKMLSDLILEVMYSGNDQLGIQQIIESIRNSFHLAPIEYEVEQCLNSLVKSHQVIQKEKTYFLSELAKSQIHASLVKGRDNLAGRFDSFNNAIKEFYGEAIEKGDIQKLWNSFNEYLLECFMVFGRKAIDIFLPYKNTEVLQDSNISERAKASLQSEKLYSAFERIVVEYPNRMTEAELQHLEGLAHGAERFYSLGIEKEEYEKINNLQIKDLLVVADTNILYTVLNIRVHPEKSAITEIVRLAKDKIIDFQIVYLPKTYKELQRAKRPLESLIFREKFKPGQIKAMLASKKLDALASQYYENKLQNSEYPHPADNITYASDILKQARIMLYNEKFPEIEDDRKLFNKKIAQYLDYEHFYNNMYDQKGIDVHLNKEDYKIAHDVFLREAITDLKKKLSKDILKVICLTTDRSLIHFDQHMLGKENVGSQSIVNPNFIMPSLFIKKIRPFIPIVTTNYRRAFISSLTAPSLHKENESEKARTILTQKSLTYFKNLGIEDEEIICEIIKRELFLEELSNHEKENSAEEFIKSEISKQIENIKLHRASLVVEIEAQRKSAEKTLEKKREEIDKVKSEKEKTEKEKQSEIDKLVSKIKEKEALEQHLHRLNEEKEKFSRERAIEFKRQLLDEVSRAILTLENAQSPLRDIIGDQHKNLKYIFAMIPIAYFCLTAFLIYKLGWNVMGVYTFLVTLFVGVCGYIYLAVSGESFDPAKYFQNKKTSITNQVYLKFKFDIEQLNNQRQRKKELEAEITALLENTTRV